MALRKRSEFVCGGLVRSLGGWSAVKALRKVGAYMKGDERILGSGDFVEGILSQAKEDLELKYRLKAEGYDFDKVVDRVSDLMGLERGEVLSPGKYKKVWRSQRRMLLGHARDWHQSRCFGTKILPFLSRQ